MKLKLPTISPRIFFERWYLPVFSSLFAIAIGAAIITFYMATRPPVSAENSPRPDATFSESLVLKINELLDLRADYFNRLRNLPPDIKNPF